MPYYLKYDVNDELIKLARRLTGYNGKNYKVEAHSHPTVTIKPSYWDGGSRTVTHVVKVDGMQSHQLPNFHPFFDGQVIPNEFEWKPGIIMVEYDQGYAEGITFVVHTDDWTARALEQPTSELTLMERVVLSMTKSLTSAGRKNDRERYRIPENDWESAKASLISKGLLAKNGAITVDGRNSVTKDMWHVLKEYEESR